ncbi:MAG: AAA domain-containing protein [Lachnospiraceae bacterium]|nr:AAA domain-containing protein [Lachnospiraceae bacterium]
MEKLLSECDIYIQNRQEIEELTGRFYLFSVQIGLDGSFTDECVQISPFFILVTEMIQKRTLNIELSESIVQGINNDVNEVLKQSERKLLSVTDINFIKKVLFNKMRINSEKEIGLEGASEYAIACKGLTKEDESTDYMSFYLNEIELVSGNYKNNSQVRAYTAALMDNTDKIMIDEDVTAMKKWLEADRFPSAKFPSRYSPTLMQQIAINIAISDKDRKEKIFSVNGPPGTGKTTLLKEIIASNVEKQAELLIQYGINGKDFSPRKIESTSTDTYLDKYYEIPEDIARYGMLVASNNNGAVENISLELPKAKGMSDKDTWTDYFDREKHEEIYFSKVADGLLGEQMQAWGLISARMGKKKYVSELLNTCIFAKKNDSPEKITLDSAREDTICWERAVENFKLAKQAVHVCKERIREDQELLQQLCDLEDEVKIQMDFMETLIMQKKKIENDLDTQKNEIRTNEADTKKIETEISYIKQHASFFNKVLIIVGIGKFGKRIISMKQEIARLVEEHGNLLVDLSRCEKEYNNKLVECDCQRDKVNKANTEYEKTKFMVYEAKNSLKSKYGQNLADEKFFADIKLSEDEQNACPWTYPDYDRKREELFYAALQVRKAFVLNSPVVRRNLFVYQTYLNGGYRSDERASMFPHLFNALSMVIPVLSSTFASVGRFLKDAGNQSLGTLIIDEAGQATPQSALGALYRTKRAIVVGDPLQVEPVVTIPQIIVDLLADGIGVPESYKKIENSVQIFADRVNEFNGMIGKMKVGCPLVVHRRCIEPMFSISNLISYDNRMFNKTKDKEIYLEETQPFMIKKSGWINVKGEEKGNGNHFVENQAVKVCEMLEEGLVIYPNLFEKDNAIYIITPFKLVASEMKSYVCQYFVQRGYSKGMLLEWTKKCVGTVHTFQGKDANEVLFVLGCSSERVGTMRWVVKKANILNVACTRAKYRIGFVGNIEDWKNLNYFDMFIPDMISVE